VLDLPDRRCLQGRKGRGSWPPPPLRSIHCTAPHIPPGRGVPKGRGPEGRRREKEVGRELEITSRQEGWRAAGASSTEAHPDPMAKSRWPLTPGIASARHGKGCLQPTAWFIEAGDLPGCKPAVAWSRPEPAVCVKFRPQEKMAQFHRPPPSMPRVARHHRPHELR